jgi:hypothetical protein
MVTELACRISAESVSTQEQTLGHKTGSMDTGTAKNWIQDKEIVCRKSHMDEKQGEWIQEQPA